MVRGGFPGCLGEAQGGRPRRGVSGRKLSSSLAVRGRIASHQAARTYRRWGELLDEGVAKVCPERPVEIRK